MAEMVLACVAQLQRIQYFLLQIHQQKQTNKNYRREAIRLDTGKLRIENVKG